MIVSDPDMVGGERVKVLDFGIAKIAESKSKVDTRTGSILGSPGYMSPEQCKNVSTVDERSDIYSLGLILYEMLAGKPALSAESDAETMAMHLFTEAPDLAQAAPQTDPELVAFVHRMLRKQPTERPSSTEVLSFLNAQSGFAASTSMPHAIIKRPSGTVAPLPPEGETLSRATGQGSSSRGRVARLSLVLSGVFVALVAVGFVARSVIVARDGKSAARMVRFRIDSTPNNVEVLRKSDLQPLGRTPLVIEQPAAQGSELLLLRHPGYVDLPLTRERGTSREVSLELSPLPAAPNTPPPSASAVEEKGAPRGKPVGMPKEKRRRPGKTTNADIDFIK